MQRLDASCQIPLIAEVFRVTSKVVFTFLPSKVMLNYQILLARLLYEN